MATVSATTLLLLTVTSIFSVSLYTKNSNISKRLASLEDKLRISAQLIAEHRQLNETQRTNLEQTIDAQRTQLEQTIDAQRTKLDLKVANLKLNNLQQAVAFRDEKETLISNAVSELNERSELIERIIGSIGIKVPLQEKASDNDNSGGVFIEQPDTARDELIYKADKYLKAISYLPFGKPLNGKITSRFGKRKDPVNGKKGFHTGLDFRGKKGDKIYATADGVVKKAFYNGGYGNYVLIDHGNGYTTSFSHMQAYLVRKGEQITRGQLVGLVGNTGRSTGAHLHYEICLDRKPLNPYDFMKVANLNEINKSSSEKK